MTRGALAMRLRRIADRIEPPPRRSPAPLVRLGGVWWRRDQVGALSQIAAQDQDAAS